jgi:hypothetical protein
MDTKEKILLASADMQGNGVIVTFGDGKLALYSAELLRSIFSQAEELHGTAEDTEDDRKASRSR